MTTAAGGDALPKMGSAVSKQKKGDALQKKIRIHYKTPPLSYGAAALFG